MAASKLSIEELEPVFAALREDGNDALPTALKQSIATAKRKGVNLQDFLATLAANGMQCSTGLEQWVEKEFA